MLGLNLDLGLFMPCKVNVYVKDGDVYLSALRPSVMGDFFPDPEIKEVAREVDAIVRAIVDEAK